MWISLLTRVADQFNLTPNYLSIFFKENAHDTFLNYLTRLRLEEAKRLMRDTRLSITEISERVGYASANSFTRAFKKSSMSPHPVPGKQRSFVIFTPVAQNCVTGVILHRPFSAQNTKPRCFPT